MKYTVYEGKEPVGEISVDSHGLYFGVACKVKPQERIRRIYAIRGTDSICLGIPDRNGVFERRIPVKHLPAPDRIIASSAEPGPWIPWSGDYFGPMVYDSFLRSEEGGWSLAVAPNELENIPQWKEIGKGETVDSRPMIRVDMGTDGQLPQIEKENEGEKYEVHIQNRGDNLDPLLLADLPADYDYGGNGIEETHSDYL